MATGLIIMAIPLYCQSGLETMEPTSTGNIVVRRRERRIEVRSSRREEVTVELTDTPPKYDELFPGPGQFQ